MKVDFGKVWILSTILLFLILFSNIIISDSNPFTTSKTCSQTWNTSCNSNFNDAFPPCNGTQSSGNAHINEVYLNASSVFFGDALNVTCESKHLTPATYEYIWYDNDSTSNNWISLENWTETFTNTSNHSIVFTPNSTATTQIIRCVLSYSNTTPDVCANSTYSTSYDNDDVNFTVTPHLNYIFWNLTNYTSGEIISNGQTYNRSNSGNITYIIVSAYWNKNISFAQIEHNGTGSWKNYTICSYPNCTGGWTNYTLNLSNASEFNVQTIGIRSIYVNDTTSVYNNTSPYLYFNLRTGSAPNITSYWLYPSTNITNLYTNLTVYANVSDEIGIASVRANVTYPDNSSRLLYLSGNPNPGNQTWNLTFDTQNTTLNETGNYTVWWVMVNNTGNLATNLTSALNFTVVNGLNLSISIYPLTPYLISGYSTRISVYDINGAYHQHPINITITCNDKTYDYSNYSSLSNVSQYTYFSSCVSPGNYGSFPIIVNVTDAYNNTAQQSFTFSTVAEPKTSSGPGSSSGFTPSTNKTKNCSDDTTYGQCSSRIPYYCSNGTLIQYCSRCGCINSSYSCQLSGSCALVREEDFNFNLTIVRLEIKQGEDKEITGILENTGNGVLDLLSFFNASKDCCNISMQPSFELQEKEEKVVTISIHAPLYAVVGDYPNTTISIGTSQIKKDRTIDIIVGQSPHYNSLSELENELTDIENKIQDVKKAGIDTSDLDAMVEKSKALLQNANSSIASDQIDVLSASLANLTSNNQLVESRLGGLRTQAFLLQNAWLIGLFVVMSFTTMYMVPQVLLPLNKKEKELSELKEEEEALVISRVETEKQYFMRKIDENTFSKIMINSQDRILKIRAQIKERENERTQIIKAVSPLGMATWFANGIKSMPQKIKNSPKSILNRKNKNNIDSNGKVQ